VLAGAALTLLLGAWVTASGPVALFARQTPGTGTTARAPGSDFEQWSNVPPPPKKIYTSSDANEAVVAVIVWGLKLAIAGIVAAVLFVIAREIFRRAGPAPAPVAGERIDTLPEVLLEGASARVAELQTGTPSNAIVACWVRLEAEVAAAGFRLDASRTSSETTTAVLREYDVDETALHELAGLFREARFSAHELTEAHRARAADALTVLHVDLRRAAAKEALRA
jgi:uncharacterized protein DUF4129